MRAAQPSSAGRSLRLAAVAVGLVLTWAVGIPALLSLDDIAASVRRTTSQKA